MGMHDAQHVHAGSVLSPALGCISAKPALLSLRTRHSGAPGSSVSFASTAVVQKWQSLVGNRVEVWLFPALSWQSFNPIKTIASAKLL